MLKSKPKKQFQIPKWLYPVVIIWASGVGTGWALVRDYEPSRFNRTIREGSITWRDGQLWLENPGSKSDKLAFTSMALEQRVKDRKDQKVSLSVQRLVDHPLLLVWEINP